MAWQTMESFVWPSHYSQEYSCLLWDGESVIPARVREGYAEDLSEWSREGNEEVYMNDVTHWMPMPNPPGEELK